MKRFGYGILLIITLMLLQGGPASALGIKIAPLEYKTTLRDGERKQGVVDVSNPSEQAVDVSVSVRAFRQIDDNGGLEFYSDTAIENGIQPELTSIRLEPKDAVRLTFSVDGKTLPEGDVFAAIMFTTIPALPQNGVGQQVRVGTLLSLENRQPGERSAKIIDLSVPFLQLSQTSKGSYSIKNTGSKTSGFYPEVTVRSWPGGAAKTVTSSLLFGGRERSNEFSYATGYGIHRIEISYKSSTKSRWVIAIAPWMIILTVFIVLIIGVELTLLHRRRLQR